VSKNAVRLDSNHTRIVAREARRLGLPARSSVRRSPGSTAPQYPGRILGWRIDARAQVGTLIPA